MKHARVDTPDGSRIVRADGTEPRSWDTTKPVLHILPKLYIDGGIIAACPSPQVRCTASLFYPATRRQVSQGELVVREPLLIVRQPLPNRCYLVAGTPESRFGFMVPLPPTLPKEVVVRFEWRFTDAAQAAAVRGRDNRNAAFVHHVLRLRLRPTGRGQVFSTDTAAWPGSGDAVTALHELQPFAVLNEDTLPDARRNRALVRRDPATGALLLDEQLDVPGILLSDVLRLSEFEHEQLQEVRHPVARVGLNRMLLRLLGRLTPPGW